MEALTFVVIVYYFCWKEFLNKVGLSTFDFSF